MKLTEALEKARLQDLDLVEINEKAVPPIVKIVDFKKFKYEEAKKERLAKRNTHETDTKEIWLGPLIGKHDLENRLGRALEFLKEGDRVKLTVKFSGREMNHPEFGHEVLKKSKEFLAEVGEPSGESKFFGRNLALSFNPVKKPK